MAEPKKLRAPWLGTIVASAAFIAIGLAMPIGFVAAWLCLTACYRFERHDGPNEPLANRLPQPATASEPPRWLTSGATITGKVAPGPTALAPITGEVVVAFAVTLRARDGGVVARDSATVGFHIVTDTGDTVIIPPGTIDIASEPTSAAVRRLPDAYARTLDPVRPRDRHNADPFQFHHACETVIRVGEYVTLRSDAAPDTQPRLTGSYRDTPRIHLRASGRPLVTRR